MDAMVGKLLAAVEDEGMADNTIILLVGDHGGLKIIIVLSCVVILCCLMYHMHYFYDGKLGRVMYMYICFKDCSYLVIKYNNVYIQQ